jgi:hypothetical protein
MILTLPHRSAQVYHSVLSTDLPVQYIVMSCKSMFESWTIRSPVSASREFLKNFVMGPIFDTGCDVARDGDCLSTAAGTRAVRRSRQDFGWLVGSRFNNLGVKLNVCLIKLIDAHSMT